MNDKVNYRTCVCCRKLKNKYTMARVATVNGETLFDASFKLGGRGMYICSTECLEKIVTNKKMIRFYNLISKNDIIDTIKEVLKKND